MIEKIEWKRITPKLWELLLLLTAPFFMFLQVELLEENQLSNIRDPFFLVNYIWYAILLGGLLLLLRRLRYAAELAVLLSYVLGLVNHYVLEFRGTPLLPWDFKSMGTAMEVAENYDYGFTAYTWAVTGATLVFLLLLHFLLSKERLSLKSRKTGALFALYFLLAGGVWYLHSSLGLLKLHHWTVFAWNQKVQYQCCGVAASFMENLRFMDVEKPEGYDRKEIEQLADAYADTEKTEVRPNILVIMNESFADISIIKELGEEKNVMPFFNSLAENAISGRLNVSAFGGNTCNTEFEFLTSLSMAFVPSGSVPYQQYVDRRLSSLAWILKTQGYETLAVHPCKASNWNRDKVYPYLGFDDFLSEEDFVTDASSYLRGYMTDEADFDRLMEEYEARKDGEPFFIFNVTMQNHGGYSEGTQMYLDLIRKTDAALERLVKYLEEQPEPTLLLFFGDHQPNLQDGTYDAINQETDMSVYRNKYIVPFVLWANYEIEAETIEDISPGYLAPLLLKTAGLAMPPYYHLLLEAQSRVPALSVNGHKNQAGDWLAPEQSRQEETIALLERLQYNKLFDKDGYVEEMFELN